MRAAFRRHPIMAQEAADLTSYFESLPATGKTAFNAAGVVTVAVRGYMGPLAFAIVGMGLGNLFGKTGWAEWFPWSIVPLMIGMVGQPQTLPAGSYAVLAVTFVAGIVATIAQIRFADNAQ